MRTVERPKLLTVTYEGKEIRLINFADTLVYDDESSVNILIMIRFGGYPEQVKAMSDAIYGGGDIEVSLPDENEEYGKTIKIKSAGKRYYRELSHGSVYAEAILKLKDTVLESVKEYKKVKGRNALEAVSNETEKENEASSAVYFFIERNNKAQLFRLIDEKTSVPLIPEFKDYFIDELMRRKLLVQLHTHTYKEKFDVWKLKTTLDESKIITVINDGLKQGEISIPNASNDTSVFKSLEGVSDYLKQFGPMIAERIKGQFTPLFDPTKELLSPETIIANNGVKRHAGYDLYDAQLSVVEAVKRELTKKDTAIIVGECGSGKTKMGSVALKAFQLSKGIEKTFNVVVCPSHMTKKWVREIHETVNNAKAVKINNITELEELYTHFAQRSESIYVVMSKEKARDGYMRKPAAIYNKYRHVFQCPDCFETIEMNIMEDGTSYKVNADSLYFRRENRSNHKCESCGSLLWTTINPDEKTKWIKVANYGFVHSDLAREHLENTKNSKKVYREIVDIVNGKPLKTKAAYKRFSLASYIKKKMHGRIDYVIIDELHQFAQDSGQGDAAGELICTAKKAVGLTGTLFNGYSKGIWHLLWRMCPEKMLLDEQEYVKSDEFNKLYGVTETIYEIDPGYNSNRRSSKRKIKERQMPGISPLVYSRFLLENAVFISLLDMGKELPEFEEIPISLKMNKNVSKAYSDLEEKTSAIYQNDMKVAAKIMSKCRNLLLTYPDQPYNQDPVFHPITKEPLIIPQDASTFEELREKDIQLLELVDKKISSGEKVCIFTNWVGIDTQDKLYKILTERGYKTEVLKATVNPQQREDWLEEKSQEGIQVLIANPSIVETGLDLLEYTTLLFYDIGYNLFTLRQAARRSWRINQTMPRIEVYYFYYASTLQYSAVKLMATKVAVSSILEGQISNEGLAAMSDCQDMTTLLAKELTSGIKEEVEDLGQVFKKMAFLKNDDNENQLMSLLELSKKHHGIMLDDEATNITIETSMKSDLKPILQNSIQTLQEEPSQSEPKVIESFSIEIKKSTKKKINKKKQVIHENQMSIFDSISA